MTNHPLRDAKGRPLVAVTGLGIVTSLGQGQDDNWAALTAGRSGIHAIRRFPTDGLRTRIAGTVDFLAGRAALRARAVASASPSAAAEEAIAQSGIGRQGDFPGRALRRGAAGRDGMAAARGARRGLGQDGRGHLRRPASARPRAAASTPGTTSSSSAPSPTGSPTGSAPRARRSRSRPPAPRARPRSSSASRRSGAARWRRRSASAPTAR